MSERDSVSVDCIHDGLDELGKMYRMWIEDINKRIRSLPEGFARDVLEDEAVILRQKLVDLSTARGKREEMKREEMEVEQTQLRLM